MPVMSRLAQYLGLRRNDDVRQSAGAALFAAVVTVLTLTALLLWLLLGR